MSTTQSSPDHAHVTVLAFPFGCHPWPLLTLTCKLAWATPHVRFSFFNTSKSNQRLFSTSQVNLPDNLKAYDVADGVPNGHVFTPDNPIEELELFIKAAPESFGKAMDMAVAEFGRNISCLLNDAFLAFACEMAQNMHVKWVPFWVPAPYSLSAHIYTDIIHKTYANACGNGNGGVVGGLKPIDKTLDVIPGLSTMRICDLYDEILQGDSNSSLFSQTLYRMRKVLPQAGAIVMNSLQEINSTIITNDLKSKFQDVFYVDTTGCLPWLDKQKPTSVAYISFGTLAAVPPNEFVALAEALEASGVPFLWSLRDNFKQILPNEFLQRTSLQGKISHVLAHSAVGVTVGEVPMICMPILGDNMMNGRMVEAVWGIGVRVEGGVFTKNGMLKSLELVLGHEQERRMRENIKELTELVVKAAGPDGIASKDFKTLVEVISK
ncbi:hypothetical protein ACJW31_11G026900 [Castanea mollissima]